ncbi:helicase-associated domain-containing protein [Streptomyces sp. JJ36]|uniref:helicase-associated domain-containing protein n=1 Tax=Streptomyces sp. JJ36 TaxID=2736645 RepID=UPI001F34C7DC|nr:helicase-associated domain-containing protein [Streptomyces sp. JJ36]MCF6523077.1 helicase-associated domain-containing protein [Streptomyces sp. JJ36]
MSPEQPAAGTPPRTLADELRARDDAELAALLRARPDLLSPVPGDLTQLATRAGTRASVVRAVERLDRFALQTAEALAVAPEPCSREVLRALLTGDAPAPEDAAAVDARLPVALRVLRARALLWGGDDRLRLVRTAQALLAPSAARPSPTGLGPTLAEATSGISPGAWQELLAANGLPPTHDPVSALESLRALFTDPARMAEVLAAAPEESRAVLARLEWGPPYGTVDRHAPAPPIAWLLERGLLVPSGERTVVLPREVALRLRRGRAHRTPEPLPPQVRAARVHAAKLVDGTAAGQAFAALATVEELLGGWEADPPSVLRAGGLGVRDLKRTAVALDLPEPVAAFWIELAFAAGLLASDGETAESYAPTPAYDGWRDAAPEERWATLVAAWLSATRVPGLVGERDAKGRGLAALGPGLDRGLAPDVRHRVLALLAGLEPGAAPEAETVSARLEWERPLRGAAPGTSGARAGAGTSGARAGAGPDGSGAGDGPAAGARGPAGRAGPGGRRDAVSGEGEALRSRLARWALEEAELLGLTGRGALAGFARVLVPGAAPGGPGADGPPGPPPDGAAPAGSEAPADGGTAPVWGRTLPRAEETAAVEEAARGLAPLLPEPLDHVLLQADLTAVAPGPLERELGAALDVLAEVESKGGATVYRFTPASVRRALDAGRTAAEIHAFLAAHSRTPVPQPLGYLVDDVARRHGRLRVGAVSSYVRCEDGALLAEITADRRSAPLRLRLLAPTVLASPAPPEELLARLREMGYAPAAESAEGDVVVARPEARRTPPRTPPEPVPDGPPVPDATLLAAAVRAVRAGDHAATAAHKPAVRTAGARAPEGAPPRTTSADTIATMQSAVLTGAALWIGYVNADGAASQRVIAPVRVEGGFVTAYDHTADEVRTYPLHRITGVAELAEE